MLTCVLIFNIILWMRKWKFIEGELIWPSCGLLSFVWQSSMTKLRHVYFCLFNCCCPNDFCIVEDSAMVTLILQKLLFYAVQYSNNRRIVLKIKKNMQFYICCCWRTHPWPVLLTFAKTQPLLILHIFSWEGRLTSISLF